jgi:hypothetical protein
LFQHCVAGIRLLLRRLLGARTTPLSTSTTLTASTTTSRAKPSCLELLLEGGRHFFEDFWSSSTGSSKKKKKRKREKPFLARGTKTNENVRLFFFLLDSKRGKRSLETSVRAQATSGTDSTVF